MNIVLKKLPLLLEGRKLKLNEKCSSYMKKKKEMFFYDPHMGFRSLGGVRLN